MSSFSITDAAPAATPTRQANADPLPNKANRAGRAGKVTHPPFLIDTHTHFDDGVFDADRQAQTQAAGHSGVQHLLLVGYVRQHFERLFVVQNTMAHYSSQARQAAQDAPALPQAHVALGLHPFYIDDHQPSDLDTLDAYLKTHKVLALGEIGLDTYTDHMKTSASVQKQTQFFQAQLDLAVTHQMPVLLHIRKAHAQALKILKQHPYDALKLGGIAHSFSGGEQEAKAFVKLGFKLGITGQVTNPNAKKLHRAIQAAVADFGLQCLVIETDCPDMTPIMCQQPPSDSASAAHAGQTEQTSTRNIPANLPYVLTALSQLLSVDATQLAQQLWHNSCHALKTDWTMPDVTASRH